MPLLVDEFKLEATADSLAVRYEYQFELISISQMLCERVCHRKYRWYFWPVINGRNCGVEFFNEISEIA